MIIKEDLIKKAVSEFGNYNSYDINENYNITGKSGVIYEFDYIVKGPDILIAFLVINDVNALSDILLFNAKCMDCDIKNRAIIIDRDLSSDESNLVKTYNIKVVDARLKGSSSERAETGIDLLDERLGGGFLKNNVYLISGKAGTGKTILSTIFLCHGASLGEKGLIIVTDTYPEQYISNMNTMNIDFNKFYASGMIKVLEISDQIRLMKGEIIDGKGNTRKYITRIAGDIRSMIENEKIRRIVIDPVNPLLFPDDDFINMFMKAITFDGSVTLITSGIRASDLSIYGMEEYYVSGIIKLDLNYNGDLRRRMVIAKMRGTDFDGSPFYFVITKNGIEQEHEKTFREVE
ncbi:RAD55 family ATPase [Picrophilus oshimae]|uniref:Circadian clock protein KaiC n=1 Tax=Picrophilus torridus (strain ATCC 700027 / DSM 9790 / JCM 10055 / NBRC 100828 / KAW 2/3) TaxID=1122961 RepID=A0A8G2FXP7_PICTO|nr:ATPase domain-containing protein [Picrophilus oshimae]SMD31444.1 circadian clock protein KaiC [Picrophilus oshimae DSM 9789]